ncbi:MAG TPA: O-antigen ligase family protein [Steroidobacteraceae bacterium]|jgi:hypothetical protein|nr:O-antigen ligase family protein [Steroidobacteraceae bacterium]
MNVSTSSPRVEPQLPAVPRMSWSFFGLLLVADQLLLPMLHVGSVPYKVSFLLCGLWLVDTLARPTHDRDNVRDFRRFATALGLVVGCSLLGELWLAANYQVSDYGQTIRSLLIYGLVMLAFGMGLSATRFRFEWLIPILFIAVALNMATIFLRSSIPSWFVDLYYSEQQVINLMDHGVVDSRSLLEMVRPRGLFSNPNVSAHMVNVIVLFIHLGLKHGRMRTPKPLVALGIVALPLVLSMLLASRGEFLVALVLGVLNFRLVMQRSGAQARLRLVLAVSLAPVAAIVGLLRVVDVDTITENWDRIVTIADAVSKPNELSADEEQLSGIARPLLTLQRMWGRFQFSPLFGSGFSATAGPPFEAGTEFFHNDWFRIIATSGLIGLAAMLWIVWCICAPFGWVAVIPFVLPAMVNTFMLAIPAFIFYFFMIGVLRSGGRTPGLRSA